MVDDDGGDLEGGSFPFALPVLVCFLELAGLFVFVVVVFIAVDDEDLPPRRVAGAFLLLLLGLFETDAIGDDDIDTDVVFFFFETVAAVFALAPSDALPDERVLRAILTRTE